MFGGEVTHFSGKISNLTQSWSITDILLIDSFDLSFTKRLACFKKPWLTGFCSYFKLCETIGYGHLKAQILHFGAKLTGDQPSWWQGDWVPIQLLTDQQCE